MFRAFVYAVFFHQVSFFCFFIAVLSFACFAYSIQAASFIRDSSVSNFDPTYQLLNNSLFPDEKENFPTYDFLFPNPPEPALRAKALIEAPRILQDGERREFNALIMNGDAASYEWSFKTRGKAKTLAAIEFSSPNAATTQVAARWYALTRGGCSADFTSQYLIKLKVKLQSGGELIESFPLTVEVPHNWGGFVDYPETSGAPEIAFDSSRKLWTITGAGTLARIVRQPIIRASETSQFFNKIKMHEQVHLQQMNSGIFADLFQIDNLMPQIRLLADDNRQRLEQKIFQTIQQWRQSQSQLALERLPKAEKEAYAVSDKIEPRYLFNNCERFK